MERKIRLILALTLLLLFAIIYATSLACGDSGCGACSDCQYGACVYACDGCESCTSDGCLPNSNNCSACKACSWETLQCYNLNCDECQQCSNHSCAPKCNTQTQTCCYGECCYDATERCCEGYIDGGSCCNKATETCCPGDYTVECCDYFSETCCGGKCCNDETERCCNDSACCNWLNCEECNGSGSCVSKCNGCQDCDFGTCVDCLRNRGGFCDFTWPPSSSCEVDINRRCRNLGSVCNWVVTSGGLYNDTCKCCTLGTEACAEVTPYFCHEEIVWDPFPHWVCMCNDNEMGSIGYPVGTRYTCP